MSASADIQKLSVFDSRIVQNRPRFAVNKGALSITNAPFNSIAASSSQLTFNVNVPSLNVFMDRELEFTGAVNLECEVEIAAATPVAPTNAPVLAVGSQIASTAFPLHSLMNTLTATINDTTTTMNVNDVLYEVLRLVDMKRNRLQRTCPTQLDKYLKSSDATGAVNNTNASYYDATDYDNMPNGAFYNVEFFDPTSSSAAVLSGSGNYAGATNAGGAAQALNYVNGIPVLTEDTGVAGDYAVKYRLGIRITSTEKLVLSPFIFSEIHGNETGLFGINNIQVVMNLGGAERTLRLTDNGDDVVRSFSATGAPKVFSQKAWNTARLDCKFLTPSLDIDLPPRSVVPYMEYPRYITATGQSIAAGATATQQTQTITLPQIPDMLLVYARPGTYQVGEGHFYLPISKVSVNFDNFSGLLSSHTREQLYSMAVNNGLSMDWNTWNGRGKVVNRDPSTAVASQLPQGDTAPLVGGFLVIRPGKDLPLQSGQAPSVVGNYTLQMELTMTNNSDRSIDPQIYVIAINSGFFETQSGSSRILKGVLTEQDVISAPRAMDTDALHRYVGGKSKFFSSLGNALMKLAKSPVGKAAGQMAIKGVKKAVGLGAAPRGMSGGMGLAGAARMRNLM